MAGVRHVASGDGVLVAVQAEEDAAAVDMGEGAPRDGAVPDAGQIDASARGAAELEAAERQVLDELPVGGVASEREQRCQPGEGNPDGSGAIVRRPEVERLGVLVQIPLAGRVQFLEDVLHEEAVARLQHVAGRPRHGQHVAGQVHALHLRRAVGVVVAGEDVDDRLLGMCPPAGVEGGGIVLQFGGAVGHFARGVGETARARVARVDVGNAGKRLGGAAVIELLEAQRPETQRLQVGPQDVAFVRLPARDADAAADHHLLAGGAGIGDGAFGRPRIPWVEDQRFGEGIRAAADDHLDRRPQRPPRPQRSHGIARAPQAGEGLLPGARAGVTAPRRDVEERGRTRARRRRGEAEKRQRQHGAAVHVTHGNTTLRGSRPTGACAPCAAAGGPTRSRHGTVRGASGRTPGPPA